MTLYKLNTKISEHKYSPLLLDNNFFVAWLQLNWRKFYLVYTQHVPRYVYNTYYYYLTT